MAKTNTDFAKPIIIAAAEVAKVVSARVLFAYADAVRDLPALRKIVQPPTKLIVVCRTPEDEQRARDISVTVMSVPPFDLTRMAQIKMATLIAFSQQLLKAGDVFVFLTGVVGRTIDTMVSMRVGDEYELFQSVGQPKLMEHIRRPVFRVCIGSHTRRHRYHDLLNFSLTQRPIMDLHVVEEAVEDPPAVEVLSDEDRGIDIGTYREGLRSITIDAVEVEHQIRSVKCKGQMGPFVLRHKREGNRARRLV